MCEPSLTVIVHRGIPRSAKVDAVHPPLEVVHGVRVSPPVRAAGVGPGIPVAALFLFLDALRSLLLFLTDSILLIFLPTNPPRRYVRK
jgi:hypothetical protein